jgi:hypothetical protein
MQHSNIGGSKFKFELNVSVFLLVFNTTTVLIEHKGKKVDRKVLSLLYAKSCYGDVST